MYFAAVQLLVLVHVIKIGHLLYIVKIESQCFDQLMGVSKVPANIELHSGERRKFHTSNTVKQKFIVGR